MEEFFKELNNNLLKKVEFPLNKREKILIEAIVKHVEDRNLLRNKGL
jgi:hypothetical protein